MRIAIILISLFISNINIYAQDEDECQFEISKKSQKMYKKAMSELSLGHYSIGSVKLQEAIDESPEYLKAYWVLASVNRRKSNRYKKIEVAINAYEQIISLCPSYEDYYSYYYLGQLYYDNENWAKAHKNLEEFLNADNNKIHEKHFEDALDLSKYAKFYDEIYNNPVPFDPFIVKDISSKDDEYLPSLSPDNETFYFTRRFSLEKNKRVRTYGNQKEEKFCKSTKIGLNKYTLGDLMEEPFNEQSNEGGASLTIDNKELFYTRCKLKRDRTLNCDICYSKFEDGYWSEIEVLNNINTTDYWESMPSISLAVTIYTKAQETKMVNGEKQLIWDQVLILLEMKSLHSFIPILKLYTFPLRIDKTEKLANGLLVILV